MQIHTDWTTGIRDALIAAGVAGGNVEADRDRPTKPEDLPICLIAVANDQATPDGDARTGEKRFDHKVDLVVALHARAKNGPLLRQQLYAGAELICASLLPDTKVWGGVDENGIERVEGIDGFDVMYELPPEGQDVMGRTEVTLKLLHSTHWSAPLPADAADLNQIQIDASPAGAIFDLPQD